MSEVLTEYAKALLSLYSGKETEAYELICDVSDIFRDEEIRTFFSYPWVGKDKKKETISKSIPESTFRDFLYVLIDNDRISEIDGIKSSLKELIDSMENRKRVTAYSKTELSEEYMSRLRTKLEEKLGSKIDLINEIDKTIIAGVRIAYDSKEMDLTLNSRFDSLISNLKE